MLSLYGVATTISVRVFRRASVREQSHLTIYTHA